QRILRTCPGIGRTGGGEHLYLDDPNCAVTHVNGTSGQVNRPGNMNHACSSGSAMIHIGWDGTTESVPCAVVLLVCRWRGGRMLTLSAACMHVPPRPVNRSVLGSDP